MFYGPDPWMARALAARKRHSSHRWKDIVTSHRRRYLFRGFSGELLFTPEIIPVCLDFRRMIQDVKINPQELLTLDSRQFEELVAEIWRNLGYEAELTARTKDGGRDIIAVRRVEADVRFLIECKRYSPLNKVGVELVRALYGVRMHEKATKGILATTSTFTRGAKTFFDDHMWELEPRDFDGVVDWVKLTAKTSK
jgi:HJR/Mrr/RecB family endonuclease